MGYYMAYKIYVGTCYTCSISSNRNFGDEGTHHLAAALKKNKYVKILMYVFTIIVCHMPFNTCLVFSCANNRMGHCNITGVGGRYLADMLKSNKTLIELL